MGAKAVWLVNQTSCLIFISYKLIIVDVMDTSIGLVGALREISGDVILIFLESAKKTTTIGR